MFIQIRQRLYALLEKQITEFRYYFPFGRPEGALKLTLGLLERVSHFIADMHVMWQALVCLSLTVVIKNLRSSLLGLFAATFAWVFINIIH